MDFSKDNQAAFDPRDAAYRWKLFVSVPQSDGARLHFFWARIAVAGGLALLAGWLFTTAAIWASLVHGREWAGAKYSDVVLYPWRATEIRRGLARHNLARGQIEFQNKNYRTGYALLLAGLGRFPADLSARRTVATIQAQSGLLPRALDTLAEGLAYQPDLDYLKHTFGWLLEARQFDRAVALAEKILPATPDALLNHQFVALQAASAHFECGRFRQAEHLLTGWRLADSIEGTVLLAQIDWETGRKQGALDRLTAAIGPFGRSDEIYLNLVRFHRELGHDAEARRIALLRRFNEPTSPGPRIDLLHAYRATGNFAAEEREVAAYLAEFGHDTKALVNLAWYAVDTGQAALLERVGATPLEPAAEARRELEAARVQLALASHRFHEALELSAPAAAQARRASGETFPLLLGLNAVAAFAEGDAMGAGLALKAYAAQERLAVRDSLRVARELSLVGADAEARLLLERAGESDFSSQPVWEELVRLDSSARHQTGLLQSVPKVLALQKPSAAVLGEALLAIDRVAQPALFAAVRKFLCAGRTGESGVAAAGLPGVRVAGVAQNFSANQEKGRESNE